MGHDIQFERGESFGEWLHKEILEAVTVDDAPWAIEDWRTEMSELFDAGDRVIALGTYTGRAKATGKTFAARFAHLWTLDGGVIVRLQQCADTVQLARALEK